MTNKIITCGICNIPYTEKAQQNHYLTPGHLERDKTRELILSSFDSLRNWFVVPAYRVHLLERSSVNCRYVRTKKKGVVFWLTTALPYALADFCLQSLVMTPADTQNALRFDWCRIPYDPIDREAALSELTQSEALSREFTEKLSSNEPSHVMDEYVNSLYYRLEDFVWQATLSRLGHDITDSKENRCFPGVIKPKKEITDPENMRYLLQLLASKIGNATCTIDRFCIAALYRHYYRALITPSPHYKAFPNWFVNNLDEMTKRGYLRWEPAFGVFTLKTALLNNETADSPNASHFSGICYSPEMFQWNPLVNHLIDLDNRLDKAFRFLKIHDESMTSELREELAAKERSRKQFLRRIEKQLKSLKNRESLQK